MQDGIHSSPPRRPLAPSQITDHATYAATQKQVEEAVTLHPDSYSSKTFSDVELERVWHRSWVAVGYTTQIARPGDVLTVDLTGQPLLIVRDKEGAIHAFYNVCRHRGSRLVQESTNCKVIRCPYHGWGYGLNGRLLGTPYFKGLDVPSEAVEKFEFSPETATSFCKDDYPLLQVAVETWGGIIFVNLDPTPFSFAEWLGDLPHRYPRHPLSELKLVRRKTYSIRANWKLIAENFMEYYHLPWGHPELCNISSFQNHYRYQGPGMYTGMCTSPLSIDPSTCAFDLPDMPGLNYTEARSVYFPFLFPNIALWIFPHHLVTLLFRPDGPTRTIEYLDMLVHPSAMTTPGYEAALDQIFAFWCMVNEQDISLVENVQTGVAARAYSGGRLCFRFEEPVHRFQNMIIDMLTGEVRVPPGDKHEEAPDLEQLAVPHH